jgi:6-phosphogluconolactonase
VATYTGGSTALFNLKDDGSIEKQCDFVQHKGKSVNPSRQEGPHAHAAVFVAPTGTDAEFAYVADLGLDQVLMFKLDPAKGKLVPLDPPFVKLPDGCGPRHIAFNPNTGKAYVCGELDSTIITLRHDRQTGLLEPWKGEGAVLSTLPKDVPDDIRKKNSTAEIVVHPSRKTVFVSNRGHDSIATFPVTVEKTEAGPHLTSAGDNAIKTPRNFNVDPSGQWILVGNQDGGTVRVIEWSDSQGNGKMTGRKVDVKNAVCVEFVPVGK